MPPLISLVSGTFNRVELLKNMVQSFRADIPAGIDYEIVLCDGGSTDGTIEWCKSQADIVLIEHGELRGAIRAFTDAANKATGQFVILANDDVIFHPGSVLKAMAYLQDTPECGAVAYADNREVLPYHTRENWKVLHMPGMKDGKPISLIYAQVGMFRRWLGNQCGWWSGPHNEMRLARTYGGDNMLSASIWAMGYTVDKVDGCKVTDFVAEDELRAHNRAQGQIANFGDSQVYYSQFGRVGGPMVAPYPTMPQQDEPVLRVLYLPIYEPGWEIQKHGKRGLREALQRAKTPGGWRIIVAEIDYMGLPVDKLDSTLSDMVEGFQPHILLTQIQAPNPITFELLGKLRNLNPNMRIINWNGDYAFGGLTSPEMLRLLRHVDLQLTVNGTALETYKESNIPAAYWQIGYEPVSESEINPNAPEYDVVWFANAYSKSRLEFGKALFDWCTEHGYTCGLFGSGWGDIGAGNTLYDFAATRSINRKAKIAIGTNEYPDAYGFFSNRVFETIAANGALLMQQEIPGMQELTSIIRGAHYIEWVDWNDLRYSLNYYLKRENKNERQEIVTTGSSFVHQYHSFDARVTELFKLINQHIKEYIDPEANSVYLRYIGPAQSEFGINSRVSEHLHYICTPGKPLIVDKQDAAYLLSQRDLWEKWG